MAKNIINCQFENDEFIERYFVEFIYENEDENSVKDEKDKNNTKIKIGQEEEKIKKTGTIRKKEQKNDILDNHMKYLQNKRKLD